MDRGGWWAAVHGVTRSWACLSTHVHPLPYLYFGANHQYPVQDLFPFSISERGVVGSGFLLPKSQQTGQDGGKKSLLYVRRQQLGREEGRHLCEG